MIFLKDKEVKEIANKEDNNILKNSSGCTEL